MKRSPCARSRINTGEWPRKCHVSLCGCLHRAVTQLQQQPRRVPVPWGGEWARHYGTRVVMAGETRTCICAYTHPHIHTHIAVRASFLCAQPGPSLESILEETVAFQFWLCADIPDPSPETPTAPVPSRAQVSGCAPAAGGSNSPVIKGIS